MRRRITLVLLAVSTALGSAFVAAQTTAHAAGPAPGGLDHFLCYNASPIAGAPTFKIPKGVTLANQFSSTPFKPKFVAVDLHCNPALKILPRAEFPPKSPSWHLLCFAITGKQAPNKHLVKVTNQFGSARLKTGAPNQFCLPSLKSTKNPPQFDPPDPSEIRPDHFTCYPVTPVGTAVFKPPTKIRVQDQFSPQPVNVQVGQARELCVPTQKTINGNIAAQITNPAAHLLCFDVSQTPTITPVFDQNQFGVGALNIGPTKLLCLPSFKTLIK